MSATQLSFVKMTGAGNDFVVIDNRSGSTSLSAVQISRLCDRRFGIGADGLLAVEPEISGGIADYRMRYYNADGGEAEMCGNGARCFAKFIQTFPRAHENQVSFSTPAGIVNARFREGDNVEIDMTQPFDWNLAQTADFGWGPIEFHYVNTGVPHAVIFAQDVSAVPIVEQGRPIRHSPLFPKGTNVNFVQILDPLHLRVRTYERGVEDETLACGTGVVASALIAARVHKLNLPLNLRVQGGQALIVHADADFKKVTLAGPAVAVFQGTIAL